MRAINTTTKPVNIYYNYKQNAPTKKPLQQQFKHNGRPIVAVEIAAEIKMQYRSVAGMVGTDLGARRKKNIQCLLHIPMARKEQMFKVLMGHTGEAHMLQASRQLFDERMSASKKL